MANSLCLTESVCVCVLVCMKPTCASSDNCSMTSFTGHSAHKSSPCSGAHTLQECGPSPKPLQQNNNCSGNICIQTLVLRGSRVCDKYFPGKQDRDLTFFSFLFFHTQNRWEKMLDMLRKTQHSSLRMFPR